MKGLLDEEEMTPAAGPEMAQEPVQQQGQSATLDDVSEEVKPLMKYAIEMLYGENFENLIQMFQQGGNQTFAVSMSTAINGVLDRLEKEFGELPQQAAAEIGVKLFEILLEDMAAGGVINGDELGQQEIIQTIQLTLTNWAEKHPGKFNEQEFAQGMGQMAQQMGAEPQAQAAPEQGGIL